METFLVQLFFHPDLIKVMVSAIEASIGILKVMCKHYMDNNEEEEEE